MTSSSKDERALEYAKRLYLAMRVARQGATAPQKPGYVKNLANDLLNRSARRTDPALPWVRFLMDLNERGGTKADARGFADAVDAIVDDIWKDVKGPDCPKLAHLAEETAEAATDIAEARLVFDPSPPNAQRYLQVERVYSEARKPFVSIARRILHGSAA